MVPESASRTKGPDGTVPRAVASMRGQVTFLPESHAHFIPSNRPQPPRRAGISIRQKLLALIVLLMIGVVTLLAVYLPARQIDAIQTALEAKALAYARLASKQLEPAIAFDDQQTAREVFESLAQDSDIASLALFKLQGEQLAARNNLGSYVPRGTTTEGPTIFRDSEHVAVLTPVVSLEGPRGMLAVELSTHGVAEQRELVTRDAMLAGLAALLLGGLGASLIATSLSRRLRAIARVADSVAGGNLDQSPIETNATRLDEIGTVAVAFNTMLSEIRSLVSQISIAALEEQVRLERLVAERTEALHARNADLKHVLDNVGQGFLTLDLRGQISRERSAVLETWFGVAPESGYFVDLLRGADPNVAAWFATGFDALKDDILPLELCLDQLPKRISASGRQLEIHYRPILGQLGAGARSFDVPTLRTLDPNVAQSLERLLVVVSDVTERLERERAEADEREVVRLFTRAASDRTGLLEFMAETAVQVEVVTQHARERETSLLKRTLHTLKGNTAIYGIDTISDLCHSLEDKLAESEALSHEDVARLSQRWSALRAKVQPLIDERVGRLVVTEEDYEALINAVDQGMGRNDLRALVGDWRLEPIRARLGRIAEHANALGQRLNKTLDVRIEANALRLSSEKWADFWSASMHVVRNAIDHGIEDPAERIALGKPLPAIFTLSARLTRERFTIEFIDSGRGIDWTAVTRRAKSLRLAAESRQDLVDALFADGLSTRGAVTEISGRGIGLGAARQACHDLGGKVEVDSTPGVGTTFRFIWPTSASGRGPATTSQSHAELPQAEVSQV